MGLFDNWNNDNGKIGGEYIDKNKFQVGEKYLAAFEDEDVDYNVIDEIEVIKFSPSKKYMKIKRGNGEMEWREVEDFEVLEKLDD
ncbi:MAG: hypothetical protein WC389_18560 [Lutibacter sp.]|jgi:hypothetical protein